MENVCSQTFPCRYLIICLSNHNCKINTKVSVAVLQPVPTWRILWRGAGGAAGREGEAGVKRGERNVGHDFLLKQTAHKYTTCLNN